MHFWLGTHKPIWLEREPDIFVSRRGLYDRKTFPRAVGPWALDSGAFTELDKQGSWTVSADEYAAEVLRYRDEIGKMAWAAPQDWMCESKILAKTGLTVSDHQERTVRNFLLLRELLGELVIPVLQGWEIDDYLRCWDRYAAAGIDLEQERLVGVGSVCRRQSTYEAAGIFRALGGLRLHGFGVKIEGFLLYGDLLTSADSMAWSQQARYDPPMIGCTHRSCANCIRYARRWRRHVVDNVLGQTRLEIA